MACICSPSTTPAAPSAAGHTGSATARGGSTLAANGPGSRRSAPGSSAPSSPMAHGTAESHASRVACSWSTRTGRARSPRSPRPSARRSSPRSPSTRPRGGTGITGRTTALRSVTAGGGWPGTALTSAAAVRASADTSSAPGPSIETGVIYTPVDSAMPIQPVPGWLSEVLRPVQPPEPARSAGRAASTFGALRGLVRVVLDATPERDRNTRLYWSACRAAELVSAGRVDEATATSVLVDAATRTGLPETEARRTIASGLRSVAPCPQAGRP